jgi:hypothetical protein
MSSISENLMSGFRLGYGVSTNMADRAEAQQFKDASAEAVKAGGDFSTKKQYDEYRQKMQAAHNVKGDIEGGLRVDALIGNQLKTKLTDGLTQLHALADTGTPEAMQQAATLIPQVYGFLPNGQTVHTTYNPKDQSVYVTPIDEATGQPVQGSQGLALNAANLKKEAEHYLMTIPEMKAEELANAKLAEEQRATGVAERQRDTGLDLQGQQIGVAQSQVAATREADRNLAQYRTDDLRDRRAARKDEMFTKFAELSQQATQFNATIGMKGRELDQQGKLQRSEIMRNVAAADAEWMKAFQGSGETWDVKNENAAQNILNGMVRLDQSANVGTDTPTDPIALGRDAWGVMRSNPPGEMGGAEAITVVKDIKANPARYTIEQPDPNTPSGKQSLVRITDKQTGRMFKAPQSVTLGLLGPNAAPVAVPNRMPATGAPPPGAVGVPTRPAYGASGGY